MGSKVDDFVRELQDQIFEETKIVYGETAFRRWQKPLYRGSMEDPDGYACLRGVCEDSMEIFLKFENDRVKEANFQTDGCGSSTVCGSFAAEMSLDKSTEELLEITGEAIIDRIGGIPEEDRHCAFLASETLRKALNDFMVKRTRKENRR